MGLFDRGNGKPGSRGLFGGFNGAGVADNLAAAQALLAGDYAGAAAIRGRRQQVSARQAEAQQEGEQRRSLFNNLTAPRERGGQGMSPGEAELVLSNPQAFGTEYNTRFRTREISPGQEVRTPGVGEQPTQSYTAPTAEANTFNWLRGLDNGPNLSRAFAERTALPPPVAITEGGGLAGVDPATGQYRWNVPPASVGPQPSPASRGGPPTSAPRVGQSGQFSFNRVPGDSETSGYRTPEHNRRVGGVPNSYHMQRQAGGSAMASDRVPPPGMSMAQFYAELRRLNPHLDVINEGDHVHLEPRGSPSRAGGQSAASIREQAQDAIRRGADPAAVQARLRQLGGN